MKRIDEVVMMQEEDVERTVGVLKENCRLQDVKAPSATETPAG